MTARIPGINRSSLWNAWKLIRKQIKSAARRDVIDYLEYDIDPDKWINRLLREIGAGSYEPTTPHRYMLAKSKGFSRVMTFPEIPDLVLYRAIVEHLYRQMRRREHKHVYYEKATLSKITQQAAASAAETQRATSQYGTASVSRFLAWLHFTQYRKRLIFEEIYPFIVTTDITNFFDTVLHARIADNLYGAAAPPRMIGLLFFLLERLSIRHPYTDSPRIGLPVDEFDCSRKLAHIFLFPHDDRIVNTVGEEAYVRWMDDQTVGVASRAAGLRLLAELGDSLGRLHLTPNSLKTRVLSLSEARRYFHLDLNAMLDKADDVAEGSGDSQKVFRAAVTRIWRKASVYEGRGEWNKILKRIYRLAGRARLRTMRPRALRDVVANADLAERIAAYMRCTGTPSEYLAFARSVWGHEEQPYGDVNFAVFEALLRLEALGEDVATIRRLASALLSGKVRILGQAECTAVAPLLILRFGDRRSLPRLKKCFDGQFGSVPQDLVRASAIVYASYGLQEFEEVREAAGRMLQNPLARVIRMIEAIKSYDTVPQRWNARFNLHYDSVAGYFFVDMRSLLAARLLALNRRTEVLKWLKSRKEQFLKVSITPFDKDLLDRLLEL